MTPEAWMVIIPSGLGFVSVLVALLAYANERRSDRTGPVKLTLLITVFTVGSWAVMTLVIVGFGYGVWRFLY